MPVERRRVVYLSPADDCHGALLRALRAATTSIHLLIFGFTLQDVGDVLVAKHQAGLTVGVVADKRQSTGTAQKALLLRLVAAGIPVTITSSVRGGLNHQKVALVDIALGAESNQSFAIYGSFNFSASAQTQNNHLQTDNDPAVCQLLWEQYREAEAFGLSRDGRLLATSAR